MPHTGSILHGRYAVVSCHVELPLDDGAGPCRARGRRGPGVGEGLRLRGLPTTPSIGMLAGGIWGPFRRQVVHVYFPDTGLLARRRAGALRVGLAFLGLKRTATDLRELQRGLRPANTMSFANSLG